MPSYCGPPPPSGGTQVITPYGSMMSQVLQCTQFDALICSRRPPLAVVDHLVDVGRAEPHAGMAVLVAADRVADLGVDEQVHRLILVVLRAREVHVGHLVEDQLAVGGHGVGAGEDVALVEAVVIVEQLAAAYARARRADPRPYGRR